MYFISKGSVEVITPGGSIWAELNEGEFFGEMALLHKRKRNASVRAKDYADLYVLDVSTFERIQEEHPDFKMNIEEVAKDRTQDFNNMPLSNS
jgi:voltage-gated potassium channel